VDEMQIFLMLQQTVCVFCTGL